MSSMENANDANLAGRRAVEVARLASIAFGEDIVYGALQESGLLTGRPRRRVKARFTSVNERCCFI